MFLNFTTALFRKLQTHLSKIELQDGELTRPGEYILEFFGSVDMNHGNVEILLKVLDSAIDTVLNGNIVQIYPVS